MAELAVATTLGVLQIIVPLWREYEKSAKAKPQIHEMRIFLESAMAFIKNHECREGTTNHQLENDIKEVRELAQDIGDVLDEFLLHSQLYLFHNHSLTRNIHDCAHQFKNGFPLRRSIPNKMRGIERQLELITKWRKAFPERSSSASSSTRRPHHRVSPLLRDADMVGYEDEKRDFIHMLENGGGHLLVASVVGSAGSGKTTFVKNVYWDRGVMSRYDCHAWIHLGRRFDSSELLPNLLKQFRLWEQSYPLDLDAHLNFLRTYLSKRRYLVVLDDVCEEIDCTELFPDQFNGSRVVVTTRSSEVASSMATANQHKFELNGLRWPQGWDLFCRKAFSDNNNECPAELKDLSVLIVKRCERIPRSIVAVGCALARKDKLPNEWDKYHRSLDDKSLNEIHDEALLPDYMELSSNLKCCFLYFGIFPEDYSISCHRLIRLWVAEGFAIGSYTSTAEEVAEGYLKDLISRNLVDVSDTDFSGRPRNCRVLNLVLKFIIQKCEDENFASIFSEESNSQSQRIRRLSLYHDNHVRLPPFELHGVRSIFLKQLLNTPNADFNHNLREMKMLKVFDFQAAPLTKFPNSITDLILIKYLSLRGAQLKEIPSSIKKLSYLETLDLKQTDVTELPKEVSHLHNLRHLFAYKNSVPNYITFESVKGVQMHHEIGKLTKLQHLCIIKVDKRGEILKDLKKLTNLRKLGVAKLRTTHGKALSAAVEEMKNIRTLNVSAFTKGEFLELFVESNQAPRTLERLYLKGRLRRFPSWISSLANLQRIALKWSKLQTSLLESGALGNLPNLLELHMVDCYEGEELVFKASTFKMLKVLVIEELERVHTITIEMDAMANMTELSLRRCGGLKICPLGMENLRKVEKLDLFDLTAEFMDRIAESGEDHYRVAHIPVVNSFYLDKISGKFKKC